MFILIVTLAITVFSVLYIWLMLEIAYDAFAKYDDTTGVPIHRRRSYVVDFVRESDYLSHRAEREIGFLALEFHKSRGDIPMRIEDRLEWITPNRLTMAA